MKTGYFDSYDYNTIEKDILSFREKLLFNNRLYFYFHYISLVFSARRKAINKVYDYNAWSDSSFRILRLIEKTGGKFRITGMENIIRSENPVLFVSNHMSTLETMIFPSIIAPLRKVTFIVKESLVKHPLFGPVMRSRNPIVVGRSDPRKDLEAVMTKGPELLAKGISIIIFPQSTRSLEFKHEEFNSIGVKLAKKAGVNIVPVAIKTDFWGNGRIIKEIGPLHPDRPIYIKFGEPFPIVGQGKNDNNRIIEFIKSNLLEWD